MFNGADSIRGPEFDFKPNSRTTFSKANRGSVTIEEPERAKFCSSNFFRLPSRQRFLIGSEIWVVIFETEFPCCLKASSVAGNLSKSPINRCISCVRVSAINASFEAKWL
jgi:hypothetical protein